MATDQGNGLRQVVLFVIAWLIALYVFEVAQEVNQAVGFGAAAATFGLNLYARRRAAACVPGSFTFKLWLFMPAILFLVLPILIKVVVYFTSDESRSWWDHLFSLVPFMLKLGLPVLALLWVYISLGRVRKQKEDPTAPATD